MRHLKCLCFCRPSNTAIQQLTEELRDPSFGQYYLYFTNTLAKSSIERLAECDAHEVVSEVNEYFADYIAINPDFYSLNITTQEYIFYRDGTWDPATLQQSAAGLCALLLSLKKKPLIRYEVNSIACRKLAAELCYAIQNEGPLYDFRKPDTPPILLLLDRKNDMSHIPGISDEVKELVLNQEQDSFYAANMFLNLGDLGSVIKNYVDEFQKKHSSTRKIDSVADMKRFVEEYPDFKKLSGNVSKHVALMSEVSKKIANENILQVGELEQSLAVSSNNHTQDVLDIQAVLGDDKVDIKLKVGLVVLYALRYEKQTNNSVKNLKDLLKIAGATDSHLCLVDKFMEYAGSAERLDSTAVISVETFLKSTHNAFKGLQGVENVYCRHTPRLITVLEDLFKGKAKDTMYPFYDALGTTKDRPQDIIVFMVGGATYSEAMEINKLNASFGTTGVRVVLGGTSILNSVEFMNQVAATEINPNAQGQKDQGGGPGPGLPLRTAKLF